MSVAVRRRVEVSVRGLRKRSKKGQRFKIVGVVALTTGTVVNT